MLSRKYYRMIAEVIRTTRHGYTLGNVDAHASIESIADNLCYEFKHDNPNFDRDRFLKACGMEDV